MSSSCLLLGFKLLSSNCLLMFGHYDFLLQPVLFRYWKYCEFWLPLSSTIFLMPETNAYLVPFDEEGESGWVFASDELLKLFLFALPSLLGEIWYQLAKFWQTCSVEGLLVSVKTEDDISLGLKQEFHWISSVTWQDFSALVVLTVLGCILGLRRPLCIIIIISCVPIPNGFVPQKLQSELVGHFLEISCMCRVFPVCWNFMLLHFQLFIWPVASSAVYVRAD